MNINTQFAHYKSKLEKAPWLDERCLYGILALGFTFAICWHKVPLFLSLTAAVAAAVYLWRREGFNAEVWTYVLIGYLPFTLLVNNRIESFSLYFNPGDLLLAVTAFAAYKRWGMQGLRQAWQQPAGKLLALFLALTVFAWLRSFFMYGSWFAVESLPKLKHGFGAMFLFYIGFWSLRERKHFNGALVVLLTAVTFVAFLALWEYRSSGGGSFHSSRVGGIAESPNSLAAFFCGYMFFLAALFLKYWRSWRGWGWLVPVLMCLRGIMVTFSRGGYLGFAAGTLALCWLHSKRLFLAALAAGVLIFMYPQVLPEGIQYRMGMTLKKGGSWANVLNAESAGVNLETSSSYRLKIWDGAVEMIKDKPLLGVGFGAFPQFIPHYTYGGVEYFDPHNYYLLVASEMGVPALLVFLILVLFLAVRIRGLTHDSTPHLQQAAARGWLAGMVGIAVCSLFGSRFGFPVVVSYFWLFGGLLLRQRIMVDNARAEK